MCAALACAAPASAAGKSAEIKRQCDFFMDNITKKMYCLRISKLILYYFLALRRFMEDLKGRYIEIEEASGYAQPPSRRTYSEALPDTNLTENPVELQEVCYTAGGKGSRQAYSCRPQTTLTFTSSAPPRAKMHKHDYFELLFVTSAHLEVQIESRLCQFYRGDVCILNCATRHAEHYEADTALSYLVLTPDYLRNFPRGEELFLPDGLREFFAKGMRDPFLQNKDYTTFRWQNGDAPLPLQGVLADIRRQFQEKPPGYQLFVRGHLLRIFSLLADAACYKREYVDLGADDGFSLAFSAKQILDKTPHRLDRLQLADELNYSAGHIDRVFLRHYGFTVPAYNRRVCLRKAAQLLRDTSIQVHDICRQLGFVNRTNFYELFKREYGCTPAQYRRQNKL